MVAVRKSHESGGWLIVIERFIMMFATPKM